ncbi:MFS transporter [Acidisphaera sp. L21]|uniref:MFS transporter n=1 Tax=Acidisphaera sp. L21 TaxID=1641851 RepID=UPI0020B11372|nr:MFS transporter [Acidisphaera sp. L21]
MSQSQGVANSGDLERDARLVNASGHDIAPGEIAIGVVIGRMSEFFDFFVYAIASVLVFPRVFFPNAEPYMAMIYSFAIFPLAFIARPLGSVIFMAVDRKHGRGAKLTMALFLLGGSTAAISFLPDYATLGATAIVLLGLFRFLQGIALGGTWDGLASLLALNAPPHRRGWYAMMPQLGAPLGFMLAAALFAFLLATMPAEDFQDWGWRYPFFVAFAVNVVALFARLRLVATPEFTALLDRDELQPARVSATLKDNGWNILLGAFVPLACFALFHLVTVFPLAWINLYTSRDDGGFLLVQIAGAAVSIVTIVISGLVADRIGRRRLLAVGAGFIGLFSFVAPFLLGGGRSGEATFVILGFAVLGFSFGQASGAVASNFERRLRYTGAALTSDVAWLIGAGFSPLIVLSLSSHLGLIAVGGYLLSGAICTLAALMTNNQLQLDMRDR